MSLTTWLPRGRPKDGRLPSVDNFQGSRHFGSGDRVRNTATKFSETGSIGGVRPPNQTSRCVVRRSCPQQGNRPAGATDRPTTRETAQATRSKRSWQQTIEPKQIKNNKTHTRPVCNLWAEVQLAKVPNVRKVALPAHHNPAMDAMIAPPQIHLRAGFVLNTAPGAERERAARNEHDGLGPNIRAEKHGWSFCGGPRRA